MNEHETDEYQMRDFWGITEMTVFIFDGYGKCIGSVIVDPSNLNDNFGG
jgi:hypothetical protein